MPKSPIRRKTAYTPPPTKMAKNMPSPRWLAPTMLAFFGIGIIWLVVYYLTNGEAPLMSLLGPWNLAIGFAFIMAGFVLSTKWR